MRSFPRRTLLRGTFGGMSIRLALPLLDVMLDGGSASARGRRPPLRFGTFYWGGGIVHEFWVPRTTGMTWDLPDTLTPFADLRPYLTLVTGTHHEGTSPGHIPARGIALSASHDLTRCEAANCIGTYRGQAHPEPSVDALVAEAWRGRTLFDSIEVGICRKGPYKSNSSWKRGGRALNWHEPSPQRLFDRLFALHIPPEERAKTLALSSAMETSILDGVMEQTRQLEQRLGQRDRRRTAEHLEGIRGIERRLQEREKMRTARNQRACALAPPNRPARVDFGDGTGHEEKEAKSRLMSDILATALACDLTRVFSYEWSATQSHAVYWETNSRLEHHPMNHSLGDTHEYSQTIRFIMKNAAYLGQALRVLPEGDGNVLDNTLILGTSEHANANRHDYKDHPIFLLGKAGGRLRAGLHHRETRANDKLSAPRVLLSAVRAVGVPLGQLGQDTKDVSRVVRDGIGALET